MFLRLFQFDRTPFIALRLGVSAVILASFLSCSSKPTDLRTLVPSDALIYLETNDLGAALQQVVNSKAVEQAAVSKPDVSALKGVQLAVVVTGFEGSQEKLNEEQSIARIIPRFVAIADTQAWNWQAVAFAEKKLGGFVANIYDSEPQLEKGEAKGGTYFTWTAANGRKAYALVIDSLIFFGNDESAIDKCLEVRRGAGPDSLAVSGKAPPNERDTLAVGYVSTDGIGQIANIIGLQYASGSSDDADVQSAMAGIVPQLIRGAVNEITWTSTRSENGVVDSYALSMPAETAAVIGETIVPSDTVDTQMTSLPAGAPRITLYNLKDPQIAWRSVLLTSQKVTSPEAGRIIGLFSGLLFQPYAINDAEMFLSGVGANIVTANFSTDDEQPVVIAEVKDRDAVRRSLLPDLKPAAPNAAVSSVEILRSEDGDLAAAFAGKYIIAGDAEGVIKCMQGSGTESKPDPFRNFVKGSKAAASTVGSNAALARQVAEALGEINENQTAPESLYFTETRFNRNGIERRTISELGLIGWIIAQTGGDQ